MVAETRYKPYGEIRWSSGAMPTDFGYTGQRLEKAADVCKIPCRKSVVAATMLRWVCP